MFGINWDLRNDLAWEAATPAQVDEWGFGGVRSVSSEEHEPRLLEVSQAGLGIMSVVTWDSQGYISPLTDFVQIHNEMTTGQSPMTPDQYVYEWLTYKAVFASASYRWVTGGLARGGSFDIEWMREVLRKVDKRLHPDYIALHLYTHTPESARAYVDRWWNEFHIPVICTEWYRAAEEGHHAFQCMLGGNGGDGQGARCPDWNSFFCLTDHMTIYTEGTHLGLLNTDNQPKDEFYSLLSAPEECRQ